MVYYCHAARVRIGFLGDEGLSFFYAGALWAWRVLLLCLFTGASLVVCWRNQELFSWVLDRTYRERAALVARIAAFVLVAIQVDVVLSHHQVWKTLHISQTMSPRVSNEALGSKATSCMDPSRKAEGFVLCPLNFSYPEIDAAHLCFFFAVAQEGSSRSPSAAL